MKISLVFVKNVFVFRYVITFFTSYNLYPETVLEGGATIYIVQYPKLYEPLLCEHLKYILVKMLSYIGNRHIITMTDKE